MELSPIVTKEEWLAARKELLEQEKEVTRARDALSAARRALPRVLVEKDYTFESPEGTLTLLDLFQGRRQLIVRHFMFAPEAEAGCPGCSMQADSVGHLAHLHNRDTSFVMVALAPIAKIEAFRARMGWDLPFVSSFGTEFNRDFQVSTDRGEIPGISSFIREGDAVYHTNSVYDRGGEVTLNTYNYLELTLLGRQEEGLAHPWDWWRLHDSYEDANAKGPGENWWNGQDKFRS
ncbi:DUF899 domain-containing protein [Kitasatospora sp. NPDC088134]|uniref:DUF899 domain-containing protein n=1 Tax=Kitasatospora sp. NPDC088134 TaxID=3364071 RepID=UPI00382C33EE